ncbi:MAG: ABC transporter ATP-binding protein [Erysipelotrichaceae bacterium]|nr:ABC transporter ATP-binding protein [Erysipelotrichaceae bacterium]
METMLCEGLSKKYGKKTALNRINLKLEEGRIIGLVGPNGSGKTTLIKLASRLLVPTEGSISICGEKPSEKTKALVSYLPDRSFLPDWMNCEELLEMYGDFFADFDRNRAMGMLASLNIDMGMPIKAMSKGTVDKVQLILTMSRHAKLYLLDEPIAGVDPASRDYILNTIISNYDEEATVLISTHLISDVESVLDEVIFLKQGEIYLHRNSDELREETGKSIDEYFREVFRC